jgi:hypothetical protein
MGKPTILRVSGLHQEMRSIFSGSGYADGALQNTDSSHDE